LTVPMAGCLGVFPRLFDWDGDGKNDLIVGLADGRLRLWPNEGTAGAPEFGSPSYLQVGEPGEKTEIDVGQRATFDIVDWNNDGRHDLVTGGMDGRVRIFLNEADTGAADFRGESLVLDGTEALVVPGGRASVDVVDLDGDGRKDLVIGDTEGQVSFYANRGTDAVPAFDGRQLVQADAANIDLGDSPRSRPFVGDFNHDGNPDLLVGAEDGLLRLYSGLSSGGPTELPEPVQGEVGGWYLHTFEPPANQPPTAEDDSFTATENEPCVVEGPGVLENDADPQDDRIVAQLVEPVKHGELVLQEDGSFTYTPDANFNRKDSFRYRASDGLVESSITTVTITVETAYPWHNGSAPVDVNDDGYASSIDALLIIDDLNTNGSRALSQERSRPLALPFLDANRDGYVAPIDALLVIAYLNTEGSGQVEGERVAASKARELDRGPSAFSAGADLALLDDDGPEDDDTQEDDPLLERPVLVQDVPVLPVTGVPPAGSRAEASVWGEDDTDWNEEELEDVVAELAADVNDHWDI
ncbi:MAG: FG-GAP-like repeat-containing protein, partial [Planctomycetota bacterium]